MKDQSLRSREIAICVSKMTGKLSTRFICDRLKEEGYLVVNVEDLVAKFEEQEARKAVRLARRYRDPITDEPIDLINLTEVDEEGNKRQYYRNLNETTAEEEVQNCGYWKKFTDTGMRRLKYYYKRGRKRHGRKFQKMLPFDLPWLKSRQPSA